MDLVAPIIPDAQKNRAPDLLLEGLGRGLSAMAQFASIRRQSEADIARLALQEKLAGQEHELNAQKMAQSYELDNRRIQVEEELMPYRKMELEARSDYERNTKGALARRQAARISTLNDFNNQVAKYGLDDPNPRNPVEFYANARKLRDEFSWANIPEVKQVLGQINLRTKEHTIPLEVNQAVKDEDGETVIRPITKMVPIGEIVEGLKDPKKYDNVIRLLERSGLMDEKTSGNKVLREAIQAETKRVESGGGTDFKRGHSRVAPGGPLSDSGVLPERDTTLPATEEVDESDLFGSIGQTEKYLAQARAALQRKASPKAVAQRLQSFGIDPNQLWAT